MRVGWVVLAIVMGCSAAPKRPPRPMPQPPRYFPWERGTVREPRGNGHFLVMPVAGTRELRVAVSADGKYRAVAVEDAVSGAKEIALFDSGALARLVETDLEPDGFEGRFMLLGESDEPPAALYDLDAGEVRRTGPESVARDVSDDARLAASLDLFGVIHFTAPIAGRELGTIRSPLPKQSAPAAFELVSEHALVVGAEASVEVIEVPPGTHTLRVRPGVTADPDHSPIFRSPEGKRFAVLSSDSHGSSLALVDLEKWSLVHRVRLPMPLVRPMSVAFTPRGLVAVQSAARIDVIDWHSGATRTIRDASYEDKDSTAGIRRLAPTSDGEVLCAEHFETVKGFGSCALVPFLDLKASKLHRPDPKTHELCFSRPSGAVVVKIPRAGSAGVTSAGRSLVPSADTTHARECNEALSPDGSLVAVVEAERGADGAAYVDPELLLVDARLGTVRSRVALPQRPSSQTSSKLLFSDDGASLAVLWGGELFAVDASTGERFQLESGTESIDLDVYGNILKSGHRVYDLKSHSPFDLGVVTLPLDVDSHEFLRARGDVEDVIEWSRKPETTGNLRVFPDGSGVLERTAAGLLAWRPSEEDEPIVLRVESPISPGLAALNSNRTALAIWDRSKEEIVLFEPNTGKPFAATSAPEPLRALQFDAATNMTAVGASGLIHIMGRYGPYGPFVEFWTVYDLGKHGAVVLDQHGSIELAQNPEPYEGKLVHCVAEGRIVPFGDCVAVMALE